MTTTNANIRPSLSRRNSRPTLLRLDSRSSSDWTPGVLLETSPDVSKLQHDQGSVKGKVYSGDAGGADDARGLSSKFGREVVPHSQLDPNDDNARNSSSSRPRTPPRSGSDTRIASAMPPANEPLQTSHLNQRQQNHGPAQDTPMKSPCFVHSYLDKGASLADWLKGKQQNVLRDVGVAKTLDTARHEGVSPHTMPVHDSASNSHSGSSVGSPLDGYHEDEDGAASLTRQLAETAVGVREMSKQLGEYALNLPLSLSLTCSLQVVPEYARIYRMSSSSPKLAIIVS